MIKCYKCKEKIKGFKHQINIKSLIEKPQIICKKCWQKGKEDKDFCIHCGADLG
jgi:hypothetical protein